MKTPSCWQHHDPCCLRTCTLSQHHDPCRLCTCKLSYFQAYGRKQTYFMVFGRELPALHNFQPFTFLHFLLLLLIHLLPLHLLLLTLLLTLLLLLFLLLLSPCAIRIPVYWRRFVPSKQQNATLGVWKIKCMQLLWLLNSVWVPVIFMQIQGVSKIP